MRAYFKKDAEAACKYCEHGVPVPDGTAVLCEKREPKVITLNRDFKKEDFSL